MNRRACSGLPDVCAGALGGCCQAGQAGQVGAGLPQPGGGGGVVGGLAGGLGFAVGVVPAGDALDLWGGGEVDRGECAVGGGLHEQARHAGHDGEVRRLVFGAEAGCYYAGVAHGGGDAGGVQAAGQLVGEHHVGQLRLAVGALPGVVPLAVQAVEVEAAAGVGGGGDGDDPGGCAGGG